MARFFLKIIKIKDTVTSFLKGFQEKAPAAATQIPTSIATEGKNILINTLNAKFGTGNRLSKGTRMEKIATGAVVSISASGKQGTRGAQNLVNILNQGTKPHAITPRNPLGVLAMIKSKEGLVFRKFVRSHSVRPSYFTEEAWEKLQTVLHGRAKSAIDLFINDLG